MFKELCVFGGKERVNFLMKIEVGCESQGKGKNKQRLVDVYAWKVYVCSLKYKRLFFIF